MALTKEEILKADDLPKKAVNVPAWGGEVFVRTMTAIEKDQFEESNRNHEDDGSTTFNAVGYRARLIQKTVCDENGNLLFTEDDLPALQKKSGKAIDLVIKVSQELNAITDEDLKALEKNLPAALANAST